MTDPAMAWSHHAATYTRLFAPLTSYIARSLLQMIAGRLDGMPGARVLDIACGSGAFAIPAAQRGYRVVATDFAAGMLDLVRAGQRAAGVELQCQLENGEALSFADASFDAAVSVFGIFLFEDRRAGWREAARVLRPGGVFATAVWQGPEHNPMLRAQFGAMAVALPERLRPPPGARAPWMEVADATALVAEITSTTSLRDVVCRPFHASIALPNARAAWDGLRDNPVAGAILARCSADELEAMEVAVIDQLVKLTGGPDEPLVLESVANLVVANAA